MCDSDSDYFPDDFILDDKTLAVLDQEESKFKLSANTQAQQSIEPPAKRQKTTTGPWQLQAVDKTINRTESLDDLDDLDDLPDISIRHDGTYGLFDKQRRVSAPPSRHGVTLGSNSATQAGARITAGAHSSQIKVSVPTVPRRATQAPPARGTRIVQSLAPSQDVSRTQLGPPQPINRSVSSTTASITYVEELLQQIKELHKKNESVRAEMESAMEAKFAKEGEVTILRKRLEKTAQDHLAQLAKLKATKDEADAKHVQMQKQYEAEKERLKTELTFRHHELETSTGRRAVSPKKDVSQIAGLFPTQRQKSGQSDPSGPIPETPRRPRFGAISDFEKQKKSATLETRDLPSGFQTGPSRSQSMIGRKGKETTSFGFISPSPVIQSASQMPQGLVGRFPQPEMFGNHLDDGGVVEDFFPQIEVGIGDVQMVDEGSPAMTLSTQENTSVLALPSWNVILHGIILTHTPPGSSLPTLQLLVCVPPPDTGQVQSYGAALVRIFDTLGGIPTHPDGDFDRLARVICCALCEITQLLAKNNLVSPLTAVLNLLTNLAYMLPSINAVLISQCGPNHKTPMLLQVLHHIILDQLQKLDVTSENEPAELCSLARETLSLYEALVCGMPDVLEDRFNACPSMPSLLAVLLHPNRPLWFLVASTRVLLWLSSRSSLFRLLLSFPANEQASSNNESNDLDHPLVALACSLLIDPNRQEPEADELRSHIVMIFGMLSNAHPDAYMQLVESQELIPSLVLHLCRTVAPIWDENGAVLSDPRAATRTVHVVNHTALLLHHLVIGKDATLDLRERLTHAPAKTHQGLIHSFVLTFGRLSYASPPYWLEEENRKRLAGVAVLARALLERVIQGPELDLIWETYQDEGEEASETAMDVDDEEAEAQKVANA